MSAWGKLLVLMDDLPEPSLTISRDAAGDYAVAISWPKEPVHPNNHYGYGSTLSAAIHEAHKNAMEARRS